MTSGTTGNSLGCRAVTAVLLLVACFCPGYAQLTSPEQAMEQLEILMKVGKFDSALSLIEQIDQTFPRTEERAVALLQRGNIEMRRGRIDEALETFEVVRSEHPDTFQAIVAAQRIANAKLVSERVTLTEYIVAVEDNIQEAGGTPLASISPDAVWSDIPYLSNNDQKLILFSLYKEAVWAILHTPDPIPAELLAIAETGARFMRARFPQVDEGLDQLIMLESIRRDDPALLERSPDSTPPVISFDAPPVVSATTPVTVILKDGPATQSQISLGTLEVMVNGAVLEPMRLASMDGSADGVLERLEITLLPDNGWAVGQNTLIVAVRDADGNPATREFSFEVVEIGRRKPSRG